MKSKEKYARTSIWDKDKRLEKFKCWTCLFSAANPLENKWVYPCDICKDRPNRKDDRSEYIEELSADAKAACAKEEKDKEKREDEFNY